jgi:hypothetical protein
MVVGVLGELAGLCDEEGKFKCTCGKYPCGGG